ncbi:MAG: ComF family protein [Candidatus Omnitrophica bacterium]|nr:ComF family protein [Candidatus Omnitrophota bacterium]MDD5653220.1 ComF family protein [Candidatus Omnitrophota bacterium]
MLRKALKPLVNLIYPKKCLACSTRLATETTNVFTCRACDEAIKKNLPPFCISCGRQLEKKSFAKNICVDCQRRKLHFDRAFSPCRYEGVIKELLHQFKYKGKDYLGEPLGKIMTDFIREYNLPIDYLDCVIPVPLHKVKLREREFNQAKVLGEKIARSFQKDLLDSVLVRKRHTKAQAELEKNARLLNVRDSFAVTESSLVKNKNILLVDDVLTTGATCSEAAKSLKGSGANIVFVLTLAN